VHEVVVQLIRLGYPIRSHWWSSHGRRK